MSGSVTMKGQAWIYENKQVLQDLTLITPGHSSNATEVLVEDIWEDLLKTSGSKWKEANGRKGYFYWEYKQTDTDSQLADGSYSEVTIRLECPRPTPGLIESKFKDDEGNLVAPKDWSDEDINSALDSDWAKYWAKQLRDADINYSKYGSLQQKEVSFVTKEKINFDPSSNTAGEVISETTVTEISNTEFGNNPKSMEGDNLVTDLLNIMF